MWRMSSSSCNKSTSDRHNAMMTDTKSSRWTMKRYHLWDCQEFGMNLIHTMQLRMFSNDYMGTTETTWFHSRNQTVHTNSMRCILLLVITKTHLASSIYLRSYKSWVTQRDIVMQNTMIIVSLRVVGNMYVALQIINAHFNSARWPEIFNCSGTNDIVIEDTSVNKIMLYQIRSTS